MALDRVCPECHSTVSTRHRRKGLLHKFFFPLFGYFPWECSDCQTVYLRKSRGPSGTRSAAQGEVSL